MRTHTFDLPKLRSRLRKGDLGEARFVAKALRLGLNVCKPVNSDCRFDFIVEAEGKYSRMQVKSVWWPSSSWQYAVPVRSAAKLRKRYLRNEIDFFAAYVAQEDAWYIIPRAAVGRRCVVVLAPHIPGSRAHFEKYREAWHLLLPKGVNVGDLKAMAEEPTEPPTEGGWATQPCAVEGGDQEFQTSLAGLDVLPSAVPGTSCRATFIWPLAGPEELFSIRVDPR